MYLTINERFKFVVNDYVKKKLGVNNSKLANSLGVKSALFSEILNLRTNLSLELASKFLEMYPEISKEWLLIGSGEMLSGKSEDGTQFISQNDLNTLTQEYGFLPDIDFVKAHLSLSEIQLKNNVSSLKSSLREKIITLNNLAEIASSLKLDTDSYFGSRFETITESDYMKRLLESYNPATSSFDNVKLKWITLMFQFESSNDHLTYITANSIRYLKSGLNSWLDLGLIKLDQNLISKVSISAK